MYLYATEILGPMHTASHVGHWLWNVNMLIDKNIRSSDVHYQLNVSHSNTVFSCYK